MAFDPTFGVLGFFNQQAQISAQTEFQRGLLEIANRREGQTNLQTRIFARQLPRILSLQEDQFRAGVDLQRRQLTLARELQERREVTLRQRLQSEERSRAIPALTQTLLGLRQQQLQSNVVQRLLDPTSEFQPLDAGITEAIASNLRNVSSAVPIPGETLRNLRLTQAASRTQAALDIVTPAPPPPPNPASP